MTKQPIFHLLIFSLILCVTTAKAQLDSTNKNAPPLQEYPALLWEITGKQLNNASFLYAAIETNDRLAYHLTDRFFMALKSIDYVMLDVHPDSIKQALQQPEIIKRIYKGLINTGYTPGDEYYDLLSPPSFNPEIFKRILAAHSLAYADYSSDNTEELSFNDFMHMAAIKLDKAVLGAMTYVDYLDVNDITDEISKDVQKNRRDQRIDYESYRGLIDRLYDAYRQGDLGLFDTLYKQLIDFPDYFSRVHSPLKHHLLQGLIEGMSQGTVMAVFDATLIAGHDGLIEMLRNEGYTLSPIQHDILTKPNSYKEKLEKKSSRVRFSTYVSRDGTWTIPLPVHLEGGFVERDGSAGGIDMLNDIAYSVNRIRLHAQTTFQSPEYLFARMDSVVYEMVPGKIIKRKEVTIAGYPALEVLNRTSSGRLEQTIIVMTPLEAIVFRVGGPERSMKRTRAGKRFLNRSQLLKDTGDWTVVTSGHGEFSLQLPSYHIIDTVSNMVFVSPDITYEAWDPNKSSYYYFRRSLHHDLHLLEQDTFDLNYMALQIAKEIDRTLITDQPMVYGQYSAVEFAMTREAPQTDTLYGRLILRGAAHYLMLTGAADIKDRKKFFQSLQLLPFRYKLTDEWVADSTLLYSVLSSVPLQEGDREDDNRGFLMGWGIEEEDKEDESHLSQQLTSSWFHDKGGEFILVERLKMHDYRGYESYADLFEDLLLNLFIADSTLQIAGHIMDTLSVFPSLDITLRSPGTIREIRKKFILHHGVVFTLSTMYDSVQGALPYTEQFFTSFTPMKDTIVGRSPFEDKGFLVLSNFRSGDTLLVKQAIGSLYLVQFESHHKDSLRDIITNNELMIRDIASSIILVKAYGGLQCDDCEEDLADLYTRVAWSPSLQMAIFDALAQLGTESAMKEMLKIMKEDLTIPSNDDDLANLLMHLQRPGKTASVLYPDILDYLRYPEYAPFIVNLLSYLVENEAYSPAHDPDAMLSIRNTLDALLKRRRLTNQIDKADSDSDILFKPSIIPIGIDTEVETMVRYIERQIKPLFGDSVLDTDTSEIGACSFSEKSRLMISQTVALYKVLFTIPALRLELIELSNLILNGRDKNDALTLALFLFEQGVGVHDSVYNYFASEPRIRVDFYRELLYLDGLHLFDTLYLNPVSLATGFLYNHTNITISDSLQFIAIRHITTPHTDGKVFFFKYLSGRDSSRHWYLGATGIFPVVPDSKLPYDPDFVHHRATRIFPDDDIDELIDKHMSQLRTLHRKRF